MGGKEGEREGVREGGKDEGMKDGREGVYPTWPKIFLHMTLLIIGALQLH